MPTRHTIDEGALAHYRSLLEALVARGIRPMVTVHHFSNPVWIDDPRDPTCKDGPSDQNLCGLGHPQGGPLVIAAFGEFATLLGQRFGDLVDEWGTVNEPVNYLVAAHGIGIFPPGKAELLDIAKFLAVMRDYLSAHAAIYHALKQADTVDADGDGIAAAVGVPLSVIEWTAARANKPSDNPEDRAARDRITYFYHYLVPEALRQGRFDSDGDQVLDEDHPEWKGTLDWLGVQHYFRAGVTGETPLIPVLNLAPCFSPFDLGACLPPLDATFCVPQMHYEYHPGGLLPILQDFGHRWPDLPLLVTESGIATDVGARRSANIVRTLEQIARARDQGIDVRGYYHWSLYDNFEWQAGFLPHFGLYRVDLTTLARTPTDAVDTFSAIAAVRRVSAAQRDRLGGDGALPPEPGVPASVSLCTADGLGF
jgi:beta-glucosidase